MAQAPAEPPLVIEVRVNRPVADALHDVKEGFAQAGGTFEGNESAGHFLMPSPLGPVRGTYRIPHPEKVIVEIIERPPFLADSALRFFVQQYVGFTR
jgi:hypothetical protein